ncbi:DNA cytosine methyltransferase [Methylobacterium sp. C33D]
MRNSTKRRLRAVDLFCGSGAVTTGLSRTFDVVAAVDNDATACRTYKANHPGVRLFERDITELDPFEILEAVPAAADLDLLVVCAPCQPFSNQNRRKAADPRASLILQAARYAQALNPTGILFENVPGLAGSSGVYTELSRAMAAVGYVVGRPRRVNAADLGVPQRRIRCVMFAARSAERVARFETAEWSAPRTTVAQAIRALKRLESGETDPDDPLHAARRHAPIALRRLRSIPADGGSRSSLPPELRLKCHENTHGYPDVYGRMAWDDVAPTLTTGCTDVTRGRFAHPEQDRAITLREAALLQTFPPKYVFHGAYKEITTQIGNAVPVTMVAAMVPAILDALAST